MPLPFENELPGTQGQNGPFSDDPRGASYDGPADLRLAFLP